MKARVSLYVSALVLLLTLAVAVGCSKAPNDAQLAGALKDKVAGKLSEDVLKQVKETSEFKKLEASLTDLEKAVTALTTDQPELLNDRPPTVLRATVVSVTL